MKTIFIILAIVCFSFCPPAAADSIQWIYSYEEALKLASKEGKPIMAGFYTAWCSWCRKLDSVTYVDSAVVASSNDFVCLKVDAEKRRDVAYLYGVSTMPTILFLDSAGRVIWREFGYRDPQFLARRMQEVLGVFRRSTASEPYIRKAFDEAGRGNIDQAIFTLDEAVNKYPDDARLYAARSVLYKYKGDLDAALRDLDKSLSINPADDSVRTMRGAVYHEKGDREKAMADYDRSISINRWGYEAYNGRGIIYLELKDPDSALKNFNNAVLINPRYASSYFNRGIAYAYKGMFDKSISDFSMAIKLKPDMLGAYSNRAIAYLYTKQYDKSWNDVHKLERAGFNMTPEFMVELRRLSGREK